MPEAIGQLRDFASGGADPASSAARSPLAKSARSLTAPRAITSLRTVFVAFVGGFVRWSKNLVAKVRVTLSPFIGPPPIQASAYTMGAVVSSKCASGGGSLGLSGMNAPPVAVLAAVGMNAPRHTARP